MAVTVIGAGMVEAVEVAMEGGEDKLAIVKTFRTEGKGEWVIPPQLQNHLPTSTGPRKVFLFP